ncbi:aldehyde dehydrogenase family protein [Pelagicoccus sp. SDUM812003]|uniref:aldehyde dehydrogenase family protein n=1 Tax=Pelagicoccus sp. SDUM812003 TaxID=3041267 RepID=UPI00280C91A0|nr:aldehyde dehydrogenase family protein [Pelagicoccus sp. SDUM812003]MDQ8201444.1 aldehyde dehydrogenase family protein [Pelagicoccus sp. SDUM812003]
MNTLEAMHLSEASQAFLDSELGSFVNNEWVRPDAESVSVIQDPCTTEVIARVAKGNQSTLNEAVEAAHLAFNDWSRLPAVERAVYLHRLADALERNFDTIAEIESLDVGKAIVNTKGFDIPFGVDCIRYFADLATALPADTPLAIKNMEAKIHRVPYGVCGFVFPWNFPYNLLLWGIIPALAAGNTVVIKPAELTPLSTLFVAKLAQEAGFPKGVINVVTGSGSVIGSALCSHPKVKRMSFTGSSEVGKQIGEACGRALIPCKLELGGKGAAIVFEDADLDLAAEQLSAAITFNTGQVCCTATRWIVQESVADTFTEKVVAKLKAVKIGHGLAADTGMGPMASEKQLNTVIDYLETGKAQGAKAILDGERLQPSGCEKGYFMSPSLLSGDSSNICFKEEIFGPSAYLTTFKDEEEALAQVHSIDYGLANSVFSEDLDKARRVADRMICGNNWINAHNVFAYGLPYGGVNLSGLGGGVNSPETYYDYLRPQTVARPL